MRGWAFCRSADLESEASPWKRMAVAIPNLRFVPLVFSIGALVAACSGCNKKDDAPAQQNGVNDVKKSCEIRATWANRTERKCTDCIASAPSPPCNCEQFKE